MYIDAMEAVESAAKNKVQFLKENPYGYFISAMLAGAYVGFGILLIFTVGGQLGGSPFTKVFMGMSFGIALSLVVMAGSELFTGNIFVMGSAYLRQAVSLKDMQKVWVVSYLGNWAGALLLAGLFVLTGLSDGQVGEFMNQASQAKTHLSWMQLLSRAILCNILVCLAIWCSFKLKSESGKMIMIFWCLFAFITSGFEHSIANMTLLSVSLMNPVGTAISIGGYLYNILIVTLGNIVGAFVLLGVPYYFITKEKGE